MGYTQNDSILIKKGIKPIGKEDRRHIRAEWQKEVWDDMKLSLNKYGKYVILRPTGFGKTYTCANATNLDMVKDKKICFVYKSEILKKTFEEYGRGSNPIIKDHDNRIVYETYAAVGLHWGDISYLENELKISEIGLIIFDECQYMGAETYRKALDVALTYCGHTVFKDDDDSSSVDGIEAKYNIPYIGATATIERMDVDVCDKYFSVYDGNDAYYCWGEHMHSLSDAFESGLLIPPEYIYIALNEDKEHKTLTSRLRRTRDTMLKDLKAYNGNDITQTEVIRKTKELQSCIIKDADKIVHDSLLNLYKCNNAYGNTETLPDAKKGELQGQINGLPNYMRFLVFTPDRASLDQIRREHNSTKSIGNTFLGILAETQQWFESAFNRYGYTIRTTIISSDTNRERNNVKLIDPDLAVEKEIRKSRKIETEEEASKIFVKEDDMTIDLIFSINMLNIGYHVNSITGLILRRWTGSNQIYYQQLGRCLSADNNNIPIVYDFANSIVNRGINAPLFASDKSTEAQTVMADNTTYVNKKGSKKKKVKKKNAKVLNSRGEWVDPKTLNTIDAKYILVDTESASMDDIISRLNVYEINAKSHELFRNAYELYAKSYLSSNGQIINASAMVPLYETFRLCIQALMLQKKNLNRGKTIQNTVNIDALYRYVKKNKLPVYIEYRTLKQYLSNKNTGNKLVGMSHEINTLLAVSDKDNIKHSNVVLVINKNDIQQFKQDTEIQEILKGRLKNKKDILYYI